MAATHALSFAFFPYWIRSHPLFESLGPLNLISDTMEACEQVMLRGEANFLLCDHHPDAGAVVGKILNSAHGPLSCWLGGGVSVYLTTRVRRHRPES